MRCSAPRPRCTWAVLDKLGSHIGIGLRRQYSKRTLSVNDFWRLVASEMAQHPPETNGPSQCTNRQSMLWRWERQGSCELTDPSPDAGLLAVLQDTGRSVVESGCWRGHDDGAVVCLQTLVQSRHPGPGSWEARPDHADVAWEVCRDSWQTSRWTTERTQWSVLTMLIHSASDQWPQVDPVEHWEVCLAHRTRTPTT